MEGLRGVIVEGANLELEGFGFVEKVLLQGGEVVGELLPEECAASHQRGLTLELVKARRLSQLAQLAGIGDGPHGYGGCGCCCCCALRENPNWNG